MSYVGPIACPNCHSPVESDCDVCPYCYSYAPASAPWRCNWSWEWQAIAVAAIVLCFLCDFFLGTRIVATVVSWLPSDH